MKKEAYDNALRLLNDLKAKAVTKAPEDGKIPGEDAQNLRTQLEDVIKGLRDAAPESRRMVFPDDAKGDIVYRRMQLMSQLPVDVQREMDHCIIAAKILGRKSVKGLKMWDRLVSGSGELKKALDSTTATEGDEWVPTDLSPELTKLVEVYGSIQPQHRDLPMPTNPYTVPIQAGRLTAYRHNEATADTGQTKITVSDGSGLTGKVTFTAVGMGVRVLYSKEVEEDSIVGMLPFLRGEVAASIARGIEECCINGDTTATHFDSDIEALGALDRRTCWQGFRSHANDNSYEIDFGGDGNGFDFETFMKVRGKCGKFGINPMEGYWVMGLNTYIRALSLKDSNGNPMVTTIANFGNAATAKTGVLGNLAGSDIVVSEFVREVLNSTGVYESGAGQTQISYVNKPGLVFGTRRGVTLQLLTELYAESSQNALLATIRKDFQPWHPIATNPVCATGINIDTP